MAHAPAKTTLKIIPPYIAFEGNFPWHDSNDRNFGWELEQALRQRGFAIQMEGVEQEAKPTPLPLTYVIDELGKTGYRAGVCVFRESREWCADRLYLTDHDGRLAPAGGAIRMPMART